MSDARYISYEDAPEDAGPLPAYMGPEYRHKAIPAIVMLKDNLTMWDTVDRCWTVVFFDDIEPIPCLKIQEIADRD